jgi:hypothetical protein
MKYLNETKLEALEIDIPAWIEQDLTIADVEAIQQGGCASGAYMPAVTYWQALETMTEYGDNVLQYIEDSMGEIPMPSQGSSWAGMAVHFVSMAVELWAGSIDCEDLIKTLEDEKENES